MSGKNERALACLYKAIKDNKIELSELPCSLNNEEDSVFTYENADNATDITMSIGGDQFKWQISLGQQAEADASGPFIADCVANGCSAVIDMIDQDGNPHQYTVTGVSVDGAEDGQWLFTGSDTGGTGTAAKVVSTKITCMCADGPVAPVLGLYTHDICAYEKLCTIADNTTPEEPECQWVTLCDENGTGWLVCVAQDGTQSVVTGLDGSAAECVTYTSTVCVTPNAYADSVTRVRVGATWTDVPTNWLTMSEADRLQWHTDLITTELGAPTFIQSGTGAYCYEGIEGVATGYCGGRLCALAISAPRTVEDCTGPEGELVPCGDEAPEVQSTRELCSTTVGSVTEVTLSYGDGPSQVIYVDENNDPVDVDLGELSVGYCVKTFTLTEIYRYNTPTNGVNAKYWGDTDQGGNAAPHGNVSGIFPTPYTHINGAPDLEGVINTITTDWNVVDLIDTAGVSPFHQNQTGAARSANGTDQYSQQTFVIANQSTLYRDLNPQTGERVGVYLGVCGCTPKLVKEVTIDTGTQGTPRGLGEIATVSAGVVEFVALVADLSAWSGFQLEQSTDGGVTWTAVDESKMFTTAPKWECIKVWVCDQDQTIWSFDKTEQIKFNPETDNWCEPVCQECIEPEVTPFGQLVEGCISVDGEKVDAYTLIDIKGNALFAPKPLTDLGFEGDCC